MRCYAPVVDCTSLTRFIRKHCSLINTQQTESKRSLPAGTFVAWFFLHGHNMHKKSFAPNKHNKHTNHECTLASEVIILFGPRPVDLLCLQKYAWTEIRHCQTTKKTTTKWKFQSRKKTTNWAQILTTVWLGTWTNLTFQTTTTTITQVKRNVLSLFYAHDVIYENRLNSEKRICVNLYPARQNN